MLVNADSHVEITRQRAVLAELINVIPKGIMARAGSIEPNNLSRQPDLKAFTIEEQRQLLQVEHRALLDAEVAPSPSSATPRTEELRSTQHPFCPQERDEGEGVSPIPRRPTMLIELGYFLRENFWKLLRVK